MRTGWLVLLAACTAPSGGAVTVPASPIAEPTLDTATPPAVPPELPLDAAIDRGDGKTFFFLEEAYIRHDRADASADEGYPRTTGDWWPGLFTTGIDAAVADGADGWFFRGAEAVLYDLVADRADEAPVPLAEAFPGLPLDQVDAAVEIDGILHLFADHATVAWDPSAGAGPIRAIAEAFPGVPPPLDAASRTGSIVSFFTGDDVVSFDLDTRSAGPALPRAPRWPGLWDPHEGTGHPGDLVSDELSALFRARPSDAELAARKARVHASAVDGYVDRSAEYPAFVASVEERLAAWGCGLLHKASTGTWRWRCATHTEGPQRLDIEPARIPWIDWRSAGHHLSQVSQGDFMADEGTPLSIFVADEDVFRIYSITSNGPSGSISGGLNIKVVYQVGGVETVLGFSHLSTLVPGYVIDALEDGTALPVGTVFGFIGYTGNLWIAAPPAEDAPYAGTGGGLPQAHSHIWFKDDPDNHTTLTVAAREALDCSSTYPYSGG